MSNGLQTYTDAERAAFLDGWLKRVNPPKPTAVQRISPWRQHLVGAIRQGYSWRQLAKEVAPQPEVGLGKISGGYLKRCVHDAFVAAKETPPPETVTPKRRKRTKPVQYETTSATKSPEKEAR